MDVVSILLVNCASLCIDFSDKLNHLFPSFCNQEIVKRDKAKRISSEYEQRFI